MKARRGVLARWVDGRLDRSVLSDIGAIVGAGLFLFGLAQLSRPVAWIVAGALIVAASVLLVLPAKPKAVRPPKGPE
jgi:hypothetical protein